MFEHIAENGIYDYFDKYGFYDGAYSEEAERLRDSVLIELNMELKLRNSHYTAKEYNVMTHHNGSRIVFVHQHTGERVEDPNYVDELRIVVNRVNELM